MDEGGHAQGRYEGSPQARGRLRHRDGLGDGLDAVTGEPEVPPLRVHARDGGRVVQKHRLRDHSPYSRCRG